MSFFHIPLYVKLPYCVHDEPYDSDDPEIRQRCRDRLDDCFPAELDSHEEFGDNDGSHQPGLTTKFLTIPDNEEKACIRYIVDVLKFYSFSFSALK